MSDTGRPYLYVALLRGINVGGKNIIKMADLKASFEQHGLKNVATYIQSGNVIFSSRNIKASKLAAQIEAMLNQAFGYQASVVLRTHEQLQSIVANAPQGFGSAPSCYRYDVIFLKEPLTAATAMKSLRTKEGVDEANAGSGVLYFSRLTAKASQSLLSRVASMPFYQSMTIRNWNTTTKLLSLMDATMPRSG